MFVNWITRHTTLTMINTFIVAQLFHNDSIALTVWLMPWQKLGDSINKERDSLSRFPTVLFFSVIGISGKCDWCLTVWLIMPWQYHTVSITFTAVLHRSLHVYYVAVCCHIKYLLTAVVHTSVLCCWMYYYCCVSYKCATLLNVYLLLCVIQMYDVVVCLITAHVVHTSVPCCCMSKYCTCGTYKCAMLLYVYVQLCDSSLLCCRPVSFTIEVHTRFGKSAKEEKLVILF